MTFFRGLRLPTLLWLGCLLGGARLGAADFGFSVTSLPSSPVVNNTMTFNLTVTNTSGVALTNITVVNTLPDSLTIQSATAEFGTITNNGSVVIFTLDWLVNNESTALSIVALPTAFGSFTNLTVASATNRVAVTNVLAATNTYGFTVYSAVANLAAGLTGFASGVLSNDVTTYTLTATNLGPSAAPNVVISNLLPAGIRFLSISPSNSTVSFASNLLTIHLAQLNSGSLTNYRVTIQPTNAGTYAFTAGITTAGLLDTNTANNAVTNTLAVADFLAGSLVANVVSAQVYNPQTGLMQQTIRLSNLGTNPVASARVLVNGLTNQLFNAVGTNSGSPYVTYAHALAPGASVDLLLEYFVPTRLPVPNPTLVALEVPAVDPTGPTSTPPNITRLKQLAPGNILVEFDSVAGRSYTILYSEDGSFTNANSAQPPITATANRTQWIDSGPPKTVTVPGDSRLYWVKLNP